MSFETPLLDQTARAIGQGIDYMMNEIIIGGIDRMCSKVASKVSESVDKCASAVGNACKATADMGKSMLPSKESSASISEPGMGKSLEKGDDLAQGLGARSKDGGLGTQGLSAEVQKAVGNCQWKDQCNVQSASNNDLGNFSSVTAVAAMSAEMSQNVALGNQQRAMG